MILPFIGIDWQWFDKEMESEKKTEASITLKRAVGAMLIPSGERVTLAEGARVSVQFRLGGNFTVIGAFGLARISGADFDALGEPCAPEGAVAEKPKAESAPSVSSGDAKQGESGGKDSSAGSSCTMQDAISRNNANHKFPPPSSDDLWNVAKTVYDPEIPVNIVDLGLVYKLELVEEADASGNLQRVVYVDMTLTAPGCALGPMISDDLKSRLESVPGVDSAKVEIVWDPPWNQDMISEEGKMILGLV